jgi:hypothetical protein
MWQRTNFGIKPQHLSDEKIRNRRHLLAMYIIYISPFKCSDDGRRDQCVKNC